MTTSTLEGKESKARFLVDHFSMEGALVALESGGKLFEMEGAEDWEALFRGHVFGPANTACWTRIDTAGFEGGVEGSFSIAAGLPGVGANVRVLGYRAIPNERGALEDSAKVARSAAQSFQRMDIPFLLIKSMRRDAWDFLIPLAEPLPRNGARRISGKIASLVRDDCSSIEDGSFVDLLNEPGHSPLWLPFAAAGHGWIGELFDAELPDCYAPGPVAFSGSASCDILLDAAGASIENLGMHPLAWLAREWLRVEGGRSLRAGALTRLLPASSPLQSSVALGRALQEYLEESLLPGFRLEGRSSGHSWRYWLADA